MKQRPLPRRRGHAKILDFGLAKMVEASPSFQPIPSDDTDAFTINAGSLTTPGAIVGTIAQMSPEQLQVLPLDTRSDLFSFGAVLYEMATGVRPFQGKSLATCVKRSSTAHRSRRLP